MKKELLADKDIRPILAKQTYISAANHYELGNEEMKNLVRDIEQAVLQTPEVQNLIATLVESNALLTACAHERRPWAEIQDQLRMNREALIAVGGAP